MSEASVASERQHQRVGWFELFYDLVIVAAVGFGSHEIIAEPSWDMSSLIAVTMLVVLVLWLLTVLHNNLFPGDHVWRRLLVVLQMLALVVAALAVGRGNGLPDDYGLIALAVALGSIAILYAVAPTKRPHARRTAHLVALSTGLGAIVMLLAVPFPAPADLGWSDPVAWFLLAGLLVAIVPLFTVIIARVCRDQVLDDEHLGERIGQLVIIVLGESFVSLVASLSGLMTIPNPVYFVLTFLVTFALWSTYFSSVAPAGVPMRSGPLRAWLAGHWVLIVGLVFTAAGFASLVVVPFDSRDPGTAAEWTPTPLLLVLAALAVLTWLTGGPMSVVGVHVGAMAVIAFLTATSLLASEGRLNPEVAVGGLVVIADAAIAAWLRRRLDRAAVAS